MFSDLLYVLNCKYKHSGLWIDAFPVQNQHTDNWTSLCFLQLNPLRRNTLQHIPVQIYWSHSEEMGLKETQAAAASYLLILILFMIFFLNIHVNSVSLGWHGSFSESYWALRLYGVLIKPGLWPLRKTMMWGRHQVWGVQVLPQLLSLTFKRQDKHQNHQTLVEVSYIELLCPKSWTKFVVLD